MEFKLNEKGKVGRERETRLFPYNLKGQYSEIKYCQNKAYINFQMNLLRHGCGTNRREEYEREVVEALC